MPSFTPGGNLAPSLRWSMLVEASCRCNVFQWQGLGDQSGSTKIWTEQLTERSLMKTCSRALRTSDWGKVSLSYRTTTLSKQPRQRRSGFGTSLWISLGGPDMNSIEHLWRDLKIAAQWQSPANLLERICEEEWENLPKYRCAKLVESYPRL